MKKNCKALAMILCLTLSGTMTLGCGSSDSGKDISGVTNSDSETDTTGNHQETGSAVTIEEQVLYEGNDIRITATGIEDGLFGTDLKLLIENNSDQSITVQARNSNVNGFMVDTLMSADVAADKKANDSLTFETSGLKDCGIDSVATMEFTFHIMNADTWEDIADTDTIVVNTSIASTYVQNVDDSGEVLVDSNGIKIVGKGLSADDSIWGPGVILYIENNTDRNLTIQSRDVSVNGFMVETIMSEEVVAGKKAMSAVQFLSSDLESNSITDITDVELYFTIFDSNSWETIQDTDVITISF
ncbi:MAG: hypothetical protein ACI32N_10075 [Bulleidia sp.]